MSVILNGINTTLSNLTDSFGITAYPLTVFAWVRRNLDAQDNVFALINDTVGSKYCAGRTRTVYKANAVVVQDNTVISADTPTSGSVDTWIPYCWTFDTNEITVYQSTYANSAQSTSTQAYQTNNSPNIYVGASGLNTGVLDGYLAEFAVWTGVLNQTDIELLLGGDIPNTVSNGTITRYWAFDTDDANLFIDSEGAITLDDVNANTVFSALHPTMNAAASAALTGTITASTAETDIVTGGKTIILTLTDDTWAAAGTGPIGSTADTQAIIDGITSAQTETLGWNNEVRDKEVTTAVVRTSATVATITLTASAAYNITAQETITATIPAAALVTSADPVVAIPTFTVARTEKSVTVTGITGGANLSSLEWMVLDSQDLSTATILEQGSGETTDASGNLVLDLSATAAVNAQTVWYMIKDTTETESAQGPATVVVA